MESKIPFSSDKQVPRPLLAYIHMEATLYSSGVRCPVYMQCYVYIQGDDDDVAKYIQDLFVLWHIKTK